MDALKKTRTQYRKFFSKACNDFEKEELSLSNENKIMKLNIIKEKALLMIEIEMKIRNQLYDSKIPETECEKEFDESENYIDRWRNLELKYKKLSLAEKEDSVSSVDTPQINTLLRYPKIQLPSFNGDVRNWLGFWGQFQKIDKDPSLDIHDKFSYLSQAMVKGSVADELIKSFPPGGDSYEKALNQLKNRFGKDELLIQVYVRDLLSLVLQKERSQKNSLRVLYDLLETKLRALEILGVTRDKYASMLFPLIESSLPEDTLRAWERYRSNNRRSRESANDGQNTTIVEKNDLSSILDFLQDEVEAEERIFLASQSFDCPKTKQTARGESKSYNDKKVVSNRLKFGNTAQAFTTADLFTSSRGQRQCIFCSNFHNSADCIKVRKLPLKERETLVEKSRCCFLCLRSGHRVRQCNVRAGCLNCGKRHHILLCRNLHSQPSSEKAIAPEEKSEKDAALANISKSPSVMLQTLMVIIRGNGKSRRARAIIDSASQRSYILKDTARDMKYEADGFEYLQHALFGGNNTGVYKHEVFKLFLKSINGDYMCNFKVLSQSIICETKPPTTDELRGQELSDFNVHVEDDPQAPIEILIGADVAGKLMTGGYKLLPSGLAAIETRLGWTIMGRIPAVNSSSSNCSTLISMTNQDLTIADLWTLDSLGITDPSENKTKQELQEAAKSHFLNTVRVEEDRFVVNLPWLENHRALPDNYELSLKRLYSTLRKLEADGLYQDYGKVFLEWLEEGVIEEVPVSEKDVTCHYLPHRHVVKENSTTRIRPVFDASAKIKGSPSLNECLEKGPNFIEMIPTILTKFRLEKIGVIADVKKAFLQIGVSPNDKNFLRFLWIDVNKDLKIYRHCRVVFGVTCSPFLLGAVIQHHLQTVLEESIYPREIIDKLLKSFYVDNCITSVKNESELRSFINVATTVMTKRKFDLRGWEHSNSAIPFAPPTNVLGYLWNKYSDTLSINLSSFKNLCDEKVTKRIILASAHKIFDPLGITCPVALLPKLILQRLWKQNLNWDQEVDLETKKEFQKWLRDVPFLSTIEIPRWIRFGIEDHELSLHVFCDASRSAYATVVFLRVERKNCVHIQLIQGKTRVAPCGRKETTIARLELLGATIAARLFSTIVKDLPIKNVYFWTDSTTVLAWLKRDDSWGVFVQNRVEEILRLTPKEAWRFVPGALNPADLPSRGCTARQLSASRWWEGPEWLYSTSALWPTVEDVIQEDEVNSERKKSIVSSMLTVELSTLLSSRTNDFKKITNIVAWIKRFIFNCRNQQKKVGELTVEDLKESEKTIVYLIQQESFYDNDKRLQTLDTFLSEGIIRLKTMVLRRDDFTEFRMPAVLPGNHPIVKALILEEHKKRGHAGVSHTLNSLRERFWILCGRRAVKSIIRSCVVCKRYSAKNNKPPTAPPPTDRVQDCNVFQVIGVDLAGPVILRDHSKAWICLFTCAVYRAVHLELVTSLSTETFLLAFHRFVARRGKPSIVYSDNGTNFTGAANIFASIDFNKISTQAKEEKIIWKFIPPGAPWWGGWWERLVGMMKTILKKTLGKASLNHEEMITVLCNCEAILNDRPLTSVTSDPGLTALTPADFLREIKNTALPDVGANVDPNFLRRRLRYIQSVREAFRTRFRQEYLGALCMKQRNCEFSPLKEGDIVLIGDDDKKKQSWPLGRIVEVFPGADGIIRRVKVKTQSGELFRAAQKIYPLELSSNEAMTNELYSEKIKIKRVSVPCKDNKEESDELSAIPINRITRHGRLIKKPEKLDL